MRFHVILILSILAGSAVTAWPAGKDLPKPEELSTVLNEDDLEDYMDFWLDQQMPKTERRNINTKNGGCTMRVNGDLGQPQPVYLHRGDLLQATGATGFINIAAGEEVTVACTGSGRTLSHANLLLPVTTTIVKCVSDDIVSSDDLIGTVPFVELVCSMNSYYEAEYTGELCYNGIGRVVRYGFIVDEVFYVTFWSCFDPANYISLYTWYPQTPEHAVHQSGVTRPGWRTGTGFFTGIGINDRYTQVQQKLVITSLVGEELADKYVTGSQYLARGHLAAKTDFVLATSQRATFFFTNAAPQWQRFNAGNWYTVEWKVRDIIGQFNYSTTVYTGTWGVSYLRDGNNEAKDIYLGTDTNNNNIIPVPLYFYKIVIENNFNQGIVFIGVNQPYLEEEEAKSLMFCEDRCRGNPDMDWLDWNPDQVNIGYSFCCSVEDFQRVVDHQPPFNTNGLLFGC